MIPMFAEKLDDFISDSLEYYTLSEIISELELKLYALKEQEKEDDE